MTGPGDGFPWPKSKVCRAALGRLQRRRSSFGFRFRGRHSLARGNLPPSQPAVTASVVTSPLTLTPWPPLDGDPGSSPSHGPYLSHLCRLPLPGEVPGPKLLGLRAWTSLGPSFSRPQGCQLLEGWVSAGCPVCRTPFLQFSQMSSCSHQHPENRLLWPLGGTFSRAGLHLIFLSAPSTQPMPGTEEAGGQKHGPETGLS